MQPINYTLDVASPVQAAVQGYGQGLAMRQQEAAIAAQQSQMAQAKMAAEADAQRRAQMERDLFEASQNPARLPEFMIRYPELADKLKEPLRAYTEEQTRGSMSFAMQVIAALDSDPEQAVALIEDRAKRQREARDPQGADVTESMARATRANPQAMQLRLAMQVAALQGGKEAIESWSKWRDSKRPKTANLGPGTKLVNEETGETIASGDEIQTDDQREYAAAQKQGYAGSFEQWVKSVKASGATRITMPKIEVKTGEGIAAQVGPMLRESREQARSGVRLVDSAARILDAADTNGIIAGPLANVRLRAAQAADALGIAGEDTKAKIAATRAVVRGMAEQAVQARSQLGGQAQISNAEQELLNKATAGDISELTVAEVVQIAKLNDRLGRTLYESHEQQMSAVRSRPELASVAPYYEVKPPAKPRPAAAGQGGRKPLSSFEGK